MFLKLIVVIISMMYVRQTIVPYTLNLYSTISRLYFSKTGRKNVSKMKGERRMGVSMGQREAIDYLKLSC